VSQKPNSFSQFSNLFLQLDNLHSAGVSIDIWRGLANSLPPDIVNVKIHFFSNMLPFLDIIIVFLTTAAVPPDPTGLTGLERCDNEKERRVYDGHDDIVDLRVVMARKPPFKWEHQEHDLEKVKG